MVRAGVRAHMAKAGDRNRSGLAPAGSQLEVIVLAAAAFHALLNAAVNTTPPCMRFSCKSFCSGYHDMSTALCSPPPHHRRA
jgi:hypothetical protein